MIIALGYDHVQAYLGICQKKLYVKKLYVKKIYVKKSRSCDILCISLLLITVACTIYIDSSLLAQFL
jgi:membrane protein CcdC involved in cytochrome C biogenesis